MTGFLVWTDGSLQVDFSAMPFAESRELREELRRRINEAVPEANIPDEGEKRHVRWFSLAALSDKQVRDEFLEPLNGPSANCVERTRNPVAPDGSARAECREYVERPGLGSGLRWRGRAVGDAAD